jgi:GntR family transcriptional regulator
LNILAGKILVDFRSGEPLYLQIARQIEQLISTGVLSPGDQLPTVRELATELRINFNTVTRAYHELDIAQLISTQRGRGTFVWNTPSKEVLRAIREERLASATQRYLKEITQLGISSEELKKYIDGQLTRWEDNSIPSGE